MFQTIHFKGFFYSITIVNMLLQKLQAITKIIAMHYFIKMQMFLEYNFFFIILENEIHCRSPKFLI